MNKKLKKELLQNNIAPHCVKNRENYDNKKNLSISIEEIFDEAN